MSDVDVSTVVARVTVAPEVAALDVTAPVARVHLAPSSQPSVQVTAPVAHVSVALSGVPGPQGPSSSGVAVTAGTTLLALQAVRIDEDENAYPVTSLEEGWIEAVAGVVLNSALAGETVALRAAGAIDNASATNPIGPLYLGEDGLLTTDPDTGLAQVRMGYGYAPNLLAIRIMTPIYH